MFILAAYPQFLLPAYGPISLQALIMGAMIVLMQFMVYDGLAVAAGRARDLLVAHPRAIGLIGRGAGALFIVLAAATMVR